MALRGLFLLDKEGRVLRRAILWNDQRTAEETLKHIFEPFFSRKVGGFGLGLPTVARIIHDHNGNIELKSSEGVGTTFKVILPTNIR